MWVHVCLWCTSVIAQRTHTFSLLSERKYHCQGEMTMGKRKGKQKLAFMGNYGDILHFQYNCISTLHIRPLTPRHAQEKPQPPSLAQDGLLFLCAVLSCVFSPGGLLIPPSCPMDIFFWGGANRTPACGHEDHLPWPLSCLLRSGGPRLVSCPCVSSVVCVMCSRL